MSTGGTSAVDLRKENDSLKVQIKDLETKLQGLMTELENSKSSVKNLESLSVELEKQNKLLKEEGIAKIKDVEQEGKELAVEVTAGLEFMKNVNSSIEKISGDSKELFSQNEDLAGNLAKMKEEHEAVEEEMRKMLEEQCDEVIQLRTEVAQARLQNATDKEKLFGEMQQLATTLLQSREQVKVAKQTELQLRELLQNYDNKFEGLQKALQETNTAYDGFKGEMSKVCDRTKELENETVEWKNKWEQSNISLKAAHEEHTKVQTGITKSHEGLAKMTNLCKALQAERKELLEALNRTD